MSDCKHNMSLHVEGYGKLIATPTGDCPYCEIDRLKAELEEARREVDFQVQNNVETKICGADHVSSQAGFCPYCVIESLQQELSSYKQGVEVETVATLSDSGTGAEVWLDELPSEFIGQYVSVLVRAKEEV